VLLFFEGIEPEKTGTKSRIKNAAKASPLVSLVPQSASLDSIPCGIPWDFGTDGFC
jgi:hypothetical protein